MPPAPSPAPAERFARLMGALCAVVAARLERPGKPGLAGPLIILIWTRLQRMATRVTRLAARVEAGPLKPPRSRPATPRRTPSSPYQRLPLSRAWLIRLVQPTAFGAKQLAALLDDPEMAALIATAPQIGRTLRPLCRMLGVTPPPALRTPAPRTSPPPRRPARAAAPPASRPAMGRPPPRRPRRARPPAPDVIHPACGPPVPA